MIADNTSDVTWLTGTSSTTTGTIGTTVYPGRPIYIASNPGLAAWQPEPRDPTALEWLDERVDEIAGRGRKLLAA